MNSSRINENFNHSWTLLKTALKIRFGENQQFATDTWSLPLIVLTVVLHVCGLAVIGEKVVRALSEAVEHRRFMPRFAVVIGMTSLLVTLLHGIEGAVWAAAYRFLGALPDNKIAMLYSLSAMTTYGHANLFLKAPAATGAR